MRLELGSHNTLQQLASLVQQAHRPEGEFGERPGFGNRTIRPSFHRTGNSPREGHLSNRVLSLGAKTSATSFQKRAGTPSGPGGLPAPKFSTAPASSSSVNADSRLPCCPPHSPLPETGPRRLPPETDGPCSPSCEAPKDGICSTLVCTGIPKNRSQGWPEVHPRLVSSPL
jgi:hypothetical protein